MKDIVIEKYSKKYLEKVLKLSERSISTSRTSYTWQINNMSAALALKEGALIGAIPLEKRILSLGSRSPVKVLWVTGAHVDEGYRSKGVGSSMDGKIEEFFSDSVPTSIEVGTDESVYILGDDVLINLKLLDADSGESMLLEIRDSQNIPVFLQSLNTDSDGKSDISFQLDSTGNSGIYSIIVTSKNWDLSNTATFMSIPQIPKIVIGDVISKPELIFFVC